MIDIKLFRTGDERDRVLESQRARFAPDEDVHEVSNLDEAWRKSKSVSLLVALFGVRRLDVHFRLPGCPSLTQYMFLFRLYAVQYDMEKIRAELNATSKAIGRLKAAVCLVLFRGFMGSVMMERVSFAHQGNQEEAEKLMETTKETKERLAAKEAEVHDTKTKLDAKLLAIGNIVHQSVIVSDGEVRREFRFGC